MPSHVSLTDPDLHEPKGVSNASEGMVYVADGQGSGQWAYWPYGKGTYEHGATGQSITDSYSQLLIDGLGTSSDNSRLPRSLRGSGNLWASNKITPEKNQDTYLVTLSIPIVAENVSPSTLTLKMVEGSSSASPPLAETSYTLGGNPTYAVFFQTVLDAGSNMVNQGVGIFLRTDTGDVELGSPKITITKVFDGEL